MQCLMVASGRGLNPSFSGIWSRIPLMMLKKFLTIRLNPSFSGIWSRICITESNVHKVVV